MYEAPTQPAPVEVFISYSSRDLELLDQFKPHLTNLELQNVINPWHGRMIMPGKKWKNEIDDHLQKAQLILLLVSTDFLVSGYCMEIEFKQAVERAEAGEALIIPIILRPTDWDESPVANYQVLPRSALAVTSWKDRDEAFLNIVKGIRQAATVFALPPEQRRFPQWEQSHTRKSNKISILAGIIILLGSLTAYLRFAGNLLSPTQPLDDHTQVASPPQSSPTSAPVVSSTTAPTATAQTSPTISPTATPTGSPNRLTTPATVTITDTPPYDTVGGPASSATIAGKVSGVTFGDYRIVIYALTDRWWVQPEEATSLTEIGPDGHWGASIHTGKRYVALLVRPDFDPPGKIDTPPKSLKGVVASVEVEGKK